MTAANVSRIPTNAPRPQDRKPKTTPAQKAAVKARQAEAEDGYVTIEQCGVTLRIPVGGKMPLDAALIFSKDEDTLEDLGIKPENADVAGIKLILGVEQWKAFRKAGPTLDDFAAIGKQLEELTGN